MFDRLNSNQGFNRNKGFNPPHGRLESLFLRAATSPRALNVLGKGIKLAARHPNFTRKIINRVADLHPGLDQNDRARIKQVTGLAANVAETDPKLAEGAADLAFKASAQQLSDQQRRIGGNGDLASSPLNSSNNIPLAAGSGHVPGALGNGLFPNNIYQNAGGCSSCGANLVGGRRKTAKKSTKKSAKKSVKKSAKKSTKKSRR